MTEAISATPIAKSSTKRSRKPKPKDDGSILENWARLKRWEDPDGYIRVRVPGRGPVAEHTLVVERREGRRLEPWEEVNHLDGNTQSNTSDNLELTTATLARKSDARRRGFRPRWLAEGLVTKHEAQFAVDAGKKLYVYNREGRYVLESEFVDAGFPGVVKDYLYFFESNGDFPINEKLYEAVVQHLLDLYAVPLWERPPMGAVNLRNGIFNLDEGKLFLHSPEWLSPVQLPVIYDPNAECPEWDRFLSEALPPDVVEAGVAWQIFAWLMVPYTGLQKALLLFGPGASGKGTFQRGLQAFLGEENVTFEPLERLERVRFALASLVGKLAVLTGDLAFTRIEKSNVFKMIVGEDPIMAERKFEDQFSIKPFARLVFAANSHPRTRDVGDAFYRRWVVLPFPNTKAEGDRDPRLRERLTQDAELSGVLNKALAALPQVLQHGITETTSMIAEREELKLLNEPVVRFLREHIVEDPEAHVRKQAVFEQVQKFCRDFREFTPSEGEIAKTVRREFPHVQDYRPREGDTRPTAWKGICWEDDSGPNPFT